MKFVQFTTKDNPTEVRAGYVHPTRCDSIVDINRSDADIPSTLLEILRNGDVERVKRIPSKNLQTIPIKSVSLKAPILGVDKVLCVAMNYKDHCDELNVQPPKIPVVFSKFASCLFGPSDCLRLRSTATQKVDWELELAVVIGKTASDVTSADALDYVFGYTVAQDISARDWFPQDMNGGQFLLGKAMDDFCPIGPWIITADEIPDPHDLDLQCIINEDLKQNSNTKHMIFKIPQIIERITKVMTLYPGDLILTGSAAGVGANQQPPQFLAPGDTITSVIINIGYFNTKVEEFEKQEL